MTKITEAQLRKVIRNELNEMFGFNKGPTRLKTKSPVGDKVAELIAYFGNIESKYPNDQEVKEFAKKLQNLLIDQDRQAHSIRFFE